MRGIEALVILEVAAFDLAVVPGGIRTNEFVAGAQLGQGRFKEGVQMLLASDKAVGKFGTAVSLSALNEEGEFLQPGVRIPAPHIVDQPDLIFPMR